jgi:orotate phosphoribosyltransferase
MKRPDDAHMREYIRAGIREFAILHAKNQRLVSPDSQPYTWLIDLRRLFTNAEYLDAVAEAFWSRFESQLPFQIGGMEMAAVPLVSAILMKSIQKGHPVDGFIVRKERKTYGAGNLIEGELNSDPIIVVDDIFNSGQSAEKVHAVLTNEGREIRSYFSIINYESDVGAAWSNRRGIEVQSLFTLKEFGLSLTNATSRPKSGKEMFETAWTFKSPDPNFYNLVPKSFPTTDGDRVYFGSDNGLFRALDAASGELVWDFRVTARDHKNIWSAPALHDQKVFFGGYDGNVYCLDAATGREVWRNTGAEWIGSSPAIAPELGLLFIGLEFAVEGRRGAVAAIDLQSGETAWSKVTKRYTHASPIYLKNGFVACGSNDNELLLFDARTGETIWRFETRGDGAKGSIRHAPAFYERGDQLITGCADGYIYIVDVKTGNEVWSYKTGGTIYTVPLVVGDMAYIGSSDKAFYVLDLLKGEVHTKLQGRSKIFCPPALINGKIYFGSCDGTLYRIAPDSVSLDGVARLPDALTNRIAYSPKQKLFYALTYTNQMFALKET